MWETIIGVVVSVIVLPAGGVLVRMLRRQNEHETRLSVVETNVGWIKESQARTEDSIDEIREHLLGRKK